MEAFSTGLLLLLPSTPAPLPPDEVTSNPLGTCHCDGEFWLSEGCKYAFLCDSEEENGGTYVSCPEQVRRGSKKALN